MPPSRCAFVSPRFFTPPRVKVCCIESVAEAQRAIRAGASALGLVAAMPSGPGVIPEARIAEIAARVPPPVATFLLTSEQDSDAIIEQQQRCRTNTIQLCDTLSPETRATLRTALPGVKLVQVVHVTSEDVLTDARKAARHADALLLDSGNPDDPQKELGGTGRTHDWRLSRQIVAQTEVPVFLAGGLHAGNVAEAICAVRPFGVDLCTGVRVDGQLDEVSLTRFFLSVRSAAP